MWVSGSWISSSTWRSSSGLGAVHDQFDLIVHVAGQIADDARQPCTLPIMRVFITPSCRSDVMVRQPLQRHREGAAFLCAGELQGNGAGQHKFTDQGHQV